MSNINPENLCPGSGRGYSGAPHRYLRLVCMVCGRTDIHVTTKGKLWVHSKVKR